MYIYIIYIYIICMYVCIYIYIYILYMYVCIYIYIRMSIPNRSRKGFLDRKHDLPMSSHLQPCEHFATKSPLGVLWHLPSGNLKG